MNMEAWAPRSKVQCWHAGKSCSWWCTQGQADDRNQPRRDSGLRQEKFKESPDVFRKTTTTTTTKQNPQPYDAISQRVVQCIFANLCFEVGLGEDRSQLLRTACDRLLSVPLLGSYSYFSELHSTTHHILVVWLPKACTLICQPDLKSISLPTCACGVLVQPLLSHDASSTGKLMQPKTWSAGVCWPFPPPLGTDMNFTSASFLGFKGRNVSVECPDATIRIT